MTTATEVIDAFFIANFDEIASLTGEFERQIFLFDGREVIIHYTGPTLVLRHVVEEYKKKGWHEKYWLVEDGRVAEEKMKHRVCLVPVR